MTGTFEGTTEFLADNTIFFKSSISMHSETRFTDRVADRQLLRIFSTPYVERDNALTLIGIAYSVVYSFHIVAFISRKGTFLNR